MGNDSRARRWVALGALRVTILLTLAGAARAEDPNVVAREHFARGYDLARSGDANAAIHEFEQAYAASPNPSVLYNLGQAYAAAGRSSEAIDALQRYLKLSAGSVAEARQRQVQALIGYHAARVGKLAVELEPPTASLQVDGRSVGVGSRTLTLDPGPHGVLATAPGYEPASARAEVAGQAQSSLRLHLEPRAEPAQIAIACGLDGVRVFIDDLSRGQTPEFQSSVVASGLHRVRFERAGYVPDERSVQLNAGATVRVPCMLAVDVNDENRAQLTVKHPQGTRVLLDGAPFHGPVVAWGVHRVRVEGAGYAPEARVVSLQPQQRLTLTIVPGLAATEQRIARDQQRKTLRVWSYALGAVALAGGATATGLYVDNNARYSAWQAKSRKSVSTLPSDPNAPRALDALLAEENGIRRRDSLALGLAVFSCSTLVASAVLFWSSRGSADRVIVTAGGPPSVRYEHAF